MRTTIFSAQEWTLIKKIVAPALTRKSLTSSEKQRRAQLKWLGKKNITTLKKQLAALSTFLDEAEKK